MHRDKLTVTPGRTPICIECGATPSLCNVCRKVLSYCYKHATTFRIDRWTYNLCGGGECEAILQLSEPW